MKKVTCSFLLHMFFFLSIYSPLSAYDTIDSLRSTFTIENNILITANGKKYFRRSFESKLHFDLAYYMKDPKAADIVYEAYKNHILPVVSKMPEDETSNAANGAFTQALVEICMLFGNSRYSPEESFLQALLHQDEYGAQWVDEYSKEITNFINDANISLYPLPQKEQTGIFNVVIITTTASGGNHSAAESIANYLKTRKNINPILIDVEDIAQEVDPLLLATGVCTYDMTYSLIFQKTNDFFALIDRKRLNKEIQQYIPSTLLSKLKQKIVSIHPDLIISTRSYTSDDLALASLGIPLRLFHPDFELCPSMCSYYRKVNPDSIRFWLPTFCASMFKPLFEKYHRLDVYNENDGESVLLDKLSKILNTSPHSFKEQFEVIGYPCLNFFHIDEESHRSELRQKWGINENEIPIFIAMGKNGTKALKDIFDQLLNTKSQFPIKYLFVCGKNADLKEELEKKLSDSKIEEKRFIIHGLLSPNEMNEIMNISKLGISKAGGATVVESIMTKCPLLIMFSYPWEKINAAYLLKVGLAIKYDPIKKLIEQIENCLYKNIDHSKLRVEIQEWQSCLDFYLSSFINSKIEMESSNLSHMERKNNECLNPSCP